MDSFACDVLINPGLRQYKFGHFVLGEFPLWLVAEHLKYGLNPRTPRRGVQSEKVSSVKGCDGGRREQWGWSPLLAGLFYAIRSCLGLVLPEARPCAPYSQRALSGRRAAAGTRRSGEF